MSAGHLPAMSNAAFAGFLRLLLTPLDEVPAPSRELEAYLEYLRQVDGRGRRGSRRVRSGIPAGLD